MPRKDEEVPKVAPKVFEAASQGVRFVFFQVVLESLNHPIESHVKPEATTAVQTVLNTVHKISEKPKPFTGFGAPQKEPDEKPKPNLFGGNKEPQKGGLFAPKEPGKPSLFAPKDAAPPKPSLFAPKEPAKTEPKPNLAKEGGLFGQAKTETKGTFSFNPPAAAEPKNDEKSTGFSFGKSTEEKTEKKPEEKPKAGLFGTKTEEKPKTGLFGGIKTDEKVANPFGSSAAKPANPFGGSAQGSSVFGSSTGAKPTSSFVFSLGCPRSKTLKPPLCLSEPETEASL